MKQTRKAEEAVKAYIQKVERQKQTRQAVVSPGDTASAGKIISQAAAEKKTRDAERVSTSKEIAGRIFKSSPGKGRG